MPRSRSKTPVRANRARSKTPEHGHRSRTPQRIDSQRGRSKSSKVIQELDDALQENDVGRLEELQDSDFELFTRPIKFPDGGKATALSRAIEYESWDAAKAIAVKFLSADQIRNIELDLLDEGETLQSLTDNESMPRRLKSILSSAVAEAAQVDQSVQRQAPPSTRAPDKFHTGVLDIGFGECIHAWCCAPCLLGDIYGSTVEMDWKVATCILCGLEGAFSSVLSAVGLIPCVGQTTPFFVRTKYVGHHGIKEDVITSFGTNYCCYPCSIAQMHRDMIRRNLKGQKD
mmetsp:Transcript_25778/g.67678  ORF Transcript_25778/g.67678 Transcript_25778/m.67678 type:complete len:287 (+) Transcript_25778:536-1396(+)